MAEMTIEQTATDLLIEAREFISDPERWCQGTMWLDNYPPSGDMLSARRVCGIGSLERSARLHGMHGLSDALLGALNLLDLAAIRMYPEWESQDDIFPAALVNDNIGHAAILRVYDAAIAASQES